MKIHTIYLRLVALIFYANTSYATQTNNSIIKITLVEIKCTNTNNSNTKTPPIYGTLKVFMQSSESETSPKYGKSMLWEKKPQEGIALKEGECVVVNSGCSFEMVGKNNDKSTFIFQGDLYKNNIVKSKSPVVGGDSKTGHLDRYHKSDGTIRFDVKSLQQTGGKKYIRQRFGDSAVEVEVVYLVEVVG
jgi:hypothetical protein